MAYKQIVKTARLPQPSPGLGETLLFMQRLWHLVHALEVRSRRMAKTHGVTGPQRLVIRVLGKLPHSSASEVAETLGLHPSTLTGILQRLERQGLLERRPDPDDRRRVRFRLTAKARRIDRAHKGTVEAAVRRALGRAGALTAARTVRMLELLMLELARDE